MPRSNASRTSRAQSLIEQPLHHHGEDVSSEMLLADLMNSKKKQKPKLSSAQNTAGNTFLDDTNLSADNMSDTASSCSASTTSLTKDLTKQLKSKLVFLPLSNNDFVMIVIIVLFQNANVSSSLPVSFLLLYDLLEWLVSNNNHCNTSSSRLHSSNNDPLYNEIVFHAFNTNLITFRLPSSCSLLCDGYLRS